MILCEPHCDDDVHGVAGDASTHHRVRYPKVILSPIASVSNSVVPECSSPLPPSTMCAHCESHVSVVTCGECRHDLCSECDIEVHQQKGRVHHQRRLIGQSEATIKPIAPSESPEAQVEEPAADPAMTEASVRPPSALSTSSSVSALPTAVADPSVESITFTESVPTDSPSPSFVFCDYCHERPATIWCHPCQLKLCSPNGCDGEVHAMKSNIDHRRVEYPIKETNATETLSDEVNTEPPATETDEPSTHEYQRTDIDTEQDQPTSDSDIVDRIAGEKVESTAAPIRPMPMEAVDDDEDLSDSNQLLSVRALKTTHQPIDPIHPATTTHSAVSSKRASLSAPIAVDHVTEDAIAPSDSAPVPPSPTSTMPPLAMEFCDHCESHIATIYCDACVMILCQPGCDEELHALKGNTSHQRVPYPAPQKSADVDPKDDSTIDGEKSDDKQSHPHASKLNDDSSDQPNSTTVDDFEIDALDSDLKAFATDVDLDGESIDANEPTSSSTLTTLPHVQDEKLESNQSIPSTATSAPVTLPDAGLSTSPQSSQPTAPDDSDLPALPPSSSTSMPPATATATSAPVIPPTVSSTSSAAVPSKPIGKKSGTSKRLTSRDSATASTKGSSRGSRPGTSSGLPESTFTSKPIPVRPTRASVKGSERRVSPGPSTSATPSVDILAIDPTNSNPTGSTSTSTTPASNAGNPYANLGLVLPTPAISPIMPSGSLSASATSSLQDKSMMPFASTGNAEKDKVNYNYVLYSLRNKVAKLEEQLESEQARAQRAEDQLKSHHDAFTREQVRRKEVEVTLAKEKQDHATTHGSIKSLRDEIDSLRAHVASHQTTVDELIQSHRVAIQKYVDTQATLEQQVAFHSAASAEKATEIHAFKGEVEKKQAEIQQAHDAYKKEKELNQTYRTYSTQYENLILQLREKLGESERKQISMNKWKVKANQYAEEWENERKKMKRKILKLSELLEVVRKDLKDYKSILKFVSIKGYVNQWMVRRALRKLMVHATEMATTNLIEQTEATPRLHNSVQLDSSEDLSVRNSKIMNSYPWGGRAVTGGNGTDTLLTSSNDDGRPRRFPPMLTLIRSISTQLHTCAEACTLIRAQKRKWQQTADGFFQRNVELTNSYLNSDLELLSHKKKSSALRSHTRALQQKHQDLEAALTVAVHEKQRLATEIEAIEKQARQEKAVVNVIHMKKFERSVELTRRCLALETELKQLEAQREKLSADVSDASQERKALAQLAAQERESEDRAIAEAAAAQQHLLAWSTRAELGITSPTRGMVTAKMTRQISPQRTAHQGVHLVASTPHPPPDAFEHKTQSNSATLRTPDFNYAQVSRPLTAFTPYGMLPPPPVASSATPSSSGFVYPSTSSGAPVIARTTGRPVSSPDQMQFIGAMPPPPPPSQLPASQAQYSSPLPMVTTPMPRRKSGNGADPFGESNTPMSSTALPSNKSPSYIRPILAAYTSPMNVPSHRPRPTSASHLRPGSREARSHARRQAHVDALNRSILDSAMQRAQRRGAQLTGSYGRHASTGSRAAHLQANALRRSTAPYGGVMIAGSQTARQASPSPQRPIGTIQPLPPSKGAHAHSESQPAPSSSPMAPTPPPVTSLKEMMQTLSPPANSNDNVNEIN